MTTSTACFVRTYGTSGSTIVPGKLTTPLRSGDQVEILTMRNGTPSRDWLSPHLGYLTTPRARASVRHWFKHRDHDKNMASGQEIYQPLLDAYLKWMRHYQHASEGTVGVRCHSITQFLEWLGPEVMHESFGPSE